MYSGTKKTAAGAAVFRMGSCLQGCFRFFGEHSKNLLVIDSQFSQHLAVNRDACFLQAVNEAAVGKTVLTRTGVDTDNPQLTELTLSRFAVAVSILACLDDRLFGDTEDFAAGVVIAFGPLPELSCGGRVRLRLF